MDDEKNIENLINANPKEVIRITKKGKTMSNITDEKLLKRAKNAGRILLIIAVLTSIFALALFFVAFLAKGLMLITASTAIILAIISTGYWILMVAARRGNPTSVSIVIIVMLIQLTISLVLSGILAARSGANSFSFPPGLIIPVLIIITLIGSRNALLELRKRGIWHKVFENVKSTHLCIIGGIFLVIGIMAFNGVTIYTSLKVREHKTVDIQQINKFVNIIQTEEKSFFKTMENLSNPESQQVALIKITELERKVNELMKTVDDNNLFMPILETYGTAVQQWKKALLMLISPNADMTIVQKRLELGDKYRSNAIQEFDRTFAQK